MRYFEGLIHIAAYSLLLGCATTPPDLAIKNQFWSDKHSVTGIAIAKLPSASEYRVGSQGFFRSGVNHDTTDTLQKHLKTLDTSKISSLAEQLVEYLQDKGLQAELIAEPIDIEHLPSFAETKINRHSHYASKDYRALKSKLNVDRLVVLSIRRFGTLRNYDGITPVRVPSAISDLNGQMIHLVTNQLEWNQEALQTLDNARRRCDVPPNYPGLTKAIYSAFDQTQQTLFQHFTQHFTEPGMQ